MMTIGNGGFIERIRKSVRRKVANKRLKRLEKSLSECSSKAQSEMSRLEVSRSSVAMQQSKTSPLCADTVNACQDTRRQEPPSMAVAAGRTTTSHSLPARTLNPVTSSAPLLSIQSPEEEGSCTSSSGFMISSYALLDSSTVSGHTNLMPQGEGKGTCMLSATDSGLYSEEENSASDEEFLEVFSDDDVDDEEENLVDDGWLIPAEEVALDTVVAANRCETIYSGYWHGNVSVHARCSNSDETHHNILSDVSTLSNIRHENIQLFLGVCHDLHSDYISIIMDQMKGQSLYNLIHKQGHKFSFKSLTKITSQVAQGMEYLHAKGIPHPLLTSQSVTLHYRVCISMLSPGSASMGVVNPTDLAYLPPEVMKTVAMDSSSSQTGLTCPSSPHSIRGLQSRSGSISSRLSYRLPSANGWSAPTSPNLRNGSHRQMENTGFLCSGSLSCTRSSYDDLRSGDIQSRQRQRQGVQLKADTAAMQTCQANIYSFGTLLYEMLTLEKPFKDLPGNVIIFQLSRGSVHHLDNLRDGKFKQIIRRCWRPEAKARPSFQEVLSTMEQNMSPKSCGLKKAHFSFSVPSQLDKLGRLDNGGLDLS